MQPPFFSSLLAVTDWWVVIIGLGPSTGRNKDKSGEAALEKPLNNPRKQRPGSPDGWNARGWTRAGAKQATVEPRLLGPASAFVPKSGRSIVPLVVGSGEGTQNSIFLGKFFLHIVLMFQPPGNTSTTRAAQSKIWTHQKAQFTPQLGRQSVSTLVPVTMIWCDLPVMGALFWSLFPSIYFSYADSARYFLGCCVRTARASPASSLSFIWIDVKQMHRQQKAAAAREEDE